MARSGRFGSLPAAAQDLSATIASMVTQYENQRDRNIETAWKTEGGKFEGHKVTDARFLAWWKHRRAEVSSDDPMADYYDQMVHNYEYQIRQQKVTLAYTEGKINETQVAQFYAHEANRTPRNSSIWRDLMTNAAKFRKAAAQKRHASNAAAEFKAFQNQWNHLDTQYIKPMTAIENVINDITKAATGAQQLWDLAPGSREGIDLDAKLAQIETDPAVAGRWKVWRAKLEAADPSFHGHLTVEYLSHIYQRGKMGARKQAELAHRHGYKDWEKTAHTTMDGIDHKADAVSLWNETQKAVQWYQTAIDQGMNDPNKTPAERNAARASLMTKLTRLRDRELAKGNTTFSGKLTEDIYTLQGDTRGGQREGIIQATSFGAVSGFSGFSSSSGVTAEEFMAGAAKKDNEDQQQLDKGEMVLVAGPDGVLTPTNRSEVITDDPKGVSTQIVPTPGYTTVGKDGKPEVVGSGAATVVRKGTQVVVQVGDPTAYDETVGGYTATTGSAPGRSGTVGWRYDMGDGQVAWQLLQGDGTIVWTMDDPFENQMVRGQGLDNGQWVVTADPNPTDTQTVTGPDGKPLTVADPRAVLKDQFETTPQQKADAAAQQQVSDQRRLTAAGVSTYGFTTDQQAMFPSLSPENQRYLMDRGLTGIPVDQMTNAALDNARKGDAAPPGWRPEKRRAGVDTVDAQGQPTDPAEKARRDIYGIEQQLNSLSATWEIGGPNADQIRTLLGQRQAIIDNAPFSNNVKRLYGEKVDQQRRGFGLTTQDEAGTKAQNTAKQRIVEIQKEIDTSVTTETATETGPYSDPVARLSAITDRLAQLNRIAPPGKDAPYAAPGTIQAQERQRVLDAIDERKALLAERTGLEGQSSVKGYYVSQAQSAIERTQAVRQMMTGVGVTDGKNPTPLEQPNGYSTFTALYYSQDQAHRQEFAKLTDQQVQDQLLLGDPSLATDPVRMSQALGQLQQIKAGASMDEQTFAKSRMTADGLPEPVANAMIRPSDRSGKPLGLNEAQPFSDVTGTHVAKPGEEGDTGGGTDVGPFIWGGGKSGAPTAGTGVGPMITTTDASGRSTTVVGGATDRPVMKLPSFGSLFGTGNISADQALAEKRRLDEERMSRARPGYDPIAKAPIPPAMGAAAKPQPPIKTPEPPPDTFKPPKPPKAPVNSPTRSDYTAGGVASGNPQTNETGMSKGGRRANY